MKMKLIPSISALLGLKLLLLLSISVVSCIKIHYFLPPGGQAGSEIEIAGKGFSPDTSKNKVTFGELEAELLYATEETLRVVVPEGVERSRIKVSTGWLNSAKSKTDFLVLPDYLVHYEFSSPTLGIPQGYWIMYPPSYEEEGKTFPIIYTLHGNNGNFEDFFSQFGLYSFWQKNEHQLIFEFARAGMYFPFIAYSLMESGSVSELRQVLRTQLTAAAGEVEKSRVDEIIESILYYLPEDPDSWLPELAEMIMVFPDGDNSWYINRLGPPEGRNEDGLGAEPSFPTSEENNPAGRLNLHVTG